VHVDVCKWVPGRAVEVAVAQHVVVRLEREQEQAHPHAERLQRKALRPVWILPRLLNRVLALRL